MQKIKTALLTILIFLSVIVLFYNYQQEKIISSSIGGEKRAEELLVKRRLLKINQRGELSQYPVVLKAANLDTTLTILPQEKIKEYENTIKQNKEFFKRYDSSTHKITIINFILLMLWLFFVLIAIANKQVS